MIPRDLFDEGGFKRATEDKQDSARWLDSRKENCGAKR
jgi:hypothetical protein